MANEKRAQLPVGQLPADVRKELDRVLSKTNVSLEPAERAFLKARRDYLTTDQREYYEVDQDAPAGGNDGDNFDRNAAKARLKELGVQFNGNAKNEVLKQLLEEAEEKAAEDNDGEEEGGAPQLSLEEVKAKLDELEVEYEEDADEEELRELLKQAE